MLEQHGCSGIAKKSSRLYDAGIRWVDSQVARLVDTLRGLGLWENCVTGAYRGPRRGISRSWWPLPSAFQCR